MRSAPAPHQGKRHSSVLTLATDWVLTCFVAGYLIWNFRWFQTLNGPLRTPSELWSSILLVIGHTTESDSSGYRLLAQAITFYDAFVSFMSQHGWTPFWATTLCYGFQQSTALAVSRPDN